MKHFLEFSLMREQKIFIRDLQVENSYLSKFIKTKSQTTAFLKPRLITMAGNYCPALVLSNGSLIFLNAETFGKTDQSKTGTLLFEDSYSEKDQ
jgi:hypothetical protein